MSLRGYCFVRGFISWIKVLVSESDFLCRVLRFMFLNMLSVVLSVFRFSICGVFIMKCWVLGVGV